MSEPNPQQRKLIQGLEGVHLVDAGAGTGKTFALTRRYATLVQQPDVEPEDVLAVTFTRTAATEMKDRVVARSEYGMRALRDAPIQTFHSRCRDLLVEYGLDAPTYLGIADHITEDTDVLEDELVEDAEFRTFFGRFRDDHPEYADIYRIIDQPAPLLGLVNELAAKGVFPTDEGWYRDGRRHLEGDPEAFETIVAEHNRPRNGGRKQSQLRENLSGFGRNACYLPTAPDTMALRGDGKAVDEDLLWRAFTEDRETLIQFVHDIYHGYLAYALSRNYLTFGMLQLYAYVLLCEDHQLREELAYEYVMVDEFQDTSEIQFKLALLSCGTDNLCVVGDWKQSIYGFQYAAVENIQDFDARLDRFVGELNADHPRVPMDDPGVTEIRLDTNYRSTQAILDFAETGLVVPATGSEEVDEAAVRDGIASLSATRDRAATRIDAIQHENEPAALLTKLQAIVGNDDYAIEDDGELREPSLGDIAVLTRTKDFGRELVSVADAHDIPIAYEGGIEIFRTDQMKLVLAWLRILEDDIDRGWVVVLERAGYTRSEITTILENDTYPMAMGAFKSDLKALETVGAVAERVLAKYGYTETYADVVIEQLQDAYDSTTMTRGDLIRFIERGIEEGTTREVSAPAGTDAVTVQTIHAAKGLEYPIVVLANMNRYKFPTTGGGSPPIRFDEPIGLRQRRHYSDDHGHAHVYDSWQATVLQACLPTAYDEERRLLYVAMTRAESHLLFSAGAEPNTFLEELDVPIETTDPAVREWREDETVQARLDVSVPLPDGPVGWNPHELMSEGVFAETEEGRGTVFGTAVHEFAEAYAHGEAPEPGGDEPDWAHVRTFIDGLDGEVFVEQDAILPLAVDGDTVVISGVVDLVHVTADRVDVVDFKTDRDRRAAEEYRKQVSVYYHVLDAWYPDRRVVPALFYTDTADRVEVDPISRAELAALVPRLDG